MADDKTSATTEEQSAQQSTQQPVQQPTQQAGQPRANFPELLNLCNGLLHNLFFKLPKPKSKELFTDVKKGGSPELGNITLGDKITLKLKLTLDYSAFVGPGFNFDLFRTALKGLLERINTTLRLKADLNLRTNQQGAVLVGFAGTVTKDEQTNALMMVMDMGNKDEIILRLSFVDPEQFQSQ